MRPTETPTPGFWVHDLDPVAFRFPDGWPLHGIHWYGLAYAAAFARGGAAELLADFARVAARAQAAGLGVNAGHDLSQANLPAFLAGVPGVLEVSIGHALIGEALYDGLAATVARYVAIVGDRKAH